jgi:hypothetical protein
MKSLEENIEKICEILAEVTREGLEQDPPIVNKDALMILNNLTEYVMPKMTRTNTKDAHLAPDNLSFEDAESN